MSTWQRGLLTLLFRMYTLRNYDIKLLKTRVGHPKYLSSLKIFGNFSSQLISNSPHLLSLSLPSLFSSVFSLSFSLRPKQKVLITESFIPYLRLLDIQKLQEFTTITTTRLLVQTLSNYVSLYRNRYNVKVLNERGYVPSNFH